MGSISALYITKLILVVQHEKEQSDRFRIMQRIADELAFSFMTLHKLMSLGTKKHFFFLDKKEMALKCKYMGHTLPR